MPAPKDELAAAQAVSKLLSEYAACIDADALEDWPGFFTEDARYRITTAYNHANDLPVGIIHATSRDMLEDRVAALRNANVYEAQRYRHIVSVVRITGRAKTTIEAEANFLVVRTTSDGDQDLFASGRYLDRIDFSGPTPLYAEKLVVLDSDKVDTLLAIPL